MNRPPRIAVGTGLLVVAIALVLAAGCDTKLTKSQRIVGEWVGRPETAAERVVREWPRATPDTLVDPDDQQVATAVADEPPTDLEEATGVRIAMRLTDDGKAQLSLRGDEPRRGTWELEPLDGRRAVLSIEVDKPEPEPPAEGNPPNAPDEDPTASNKNKNASARPAERRRFDIEFLAPGPGFVLREAGADRRFGRLLFLPADSDAPDAPKVDPSEHVASERDAPQGDAPPPSDSPFEASP